MEQVSEDTVRSLLVLGKTYQEIPDELQQIYPSIHRGLSVRSVRRYIHEHNLKEIIEGDKRLALEESVEEVSWKIEVCGLNN